MRKKTEKTSWLYEKKKQIADIEKRLRVIDRNTYKTLSYKNHHKKSSTHFNQVHHESIQLKQQKIKSKQEEAEKIRLKNKLNNN
jgi:hypothetical protein